MVGSSAALGGWVPPGADGSPLRFDLKNRSKDLATSQGKKKDKGGETKKHTRARGVYEPHQRGKRKTNVIP